MRPYSPGGALHGFPTAESPSASPLPSAHRLQLGLPGYLIPFATLAFASQRQKTSRTSLSPRAFLPISTHFTAPPEVPGPPTSLQTGRFGARSPVEPGDFSNRRPHPPTRALSPVIPNNVRTVRLTAAAGTNLARASSRDQSSPYGPSFPSTGVYNPKAFVLHAASLGQACAHCRRFSTAASRRSLGSVSVPVCRATLARPVGIVGLVGRYPANYLIPRRPVPRRRSFGHKEMPPRDIAGDYPQFPAAIPNHGVGYRRLTHPSATGLAARTTCMPNPRRQRSF